MAKKTATISIYKKDPDGWAGVIHALGLSEEVVRKHFEFSEYATVEIVIDENLNVVGGKILPLRSGR